MEQPDRQLSEKESLDLIAQMINKAKDACHDTGVTAMMWGVVIAVCSLVRLAELHFHFRLPFDIYLLTLAAVIPQIYFSIKEKRQRKVKTYDDGFIDSLWLAFGVCIFLLVFITSAMYRQWDPAADRFKEITAMSIPFKLYEYNAAFFLLLYGLPTFVTGVSMKFKPMLLGGLCCWACCIISLYTTIKIDLLLTALSAIMAWFIPGIIMEKDYRKAKKELAAANV